jgi:cytochrome P450
MASTAATPVSELDLPAFDYTDEALTGPRFHAALAELAERSWVARAEPVGFIVLDREAVANVLRSRSATFPGRRMLEVQGVTSGPLYERLKGNLLDLDGDDHRRLRKLVQPAFTPDAADLRRQSMQRHLEDLFAEVADEGRCDFVRAFAAPYPAIMIAELMGAPTADWPRLHEWANAIQGQFDPVKVANDLERLERAAEEFMDYTRELLHARRDDPGDDLLTELLGADDQLTEDELIHLVSAILVGGVDTTQSQLAHGIRLFCEHPEQWRRLAEQPDLVPQAVEEVLRFEPITPFTARIALEEIEYRDVTFPEGTLILASAATANRDSGQDFDIEADRGRERPLTFGAGPHFCLGANLARAELAEAFTFLAPRMPDLRLDGEPEFDTPLGVYGLHSLPVAWG